MKRLRVSLDLCTQTLTLSELTARIRRAPSVTSHDRGKRRPSPDGGDVRWDRTIWRIESRADDAATLGQHLSSLVAELPPNELSRPGILPGDCQVWISVGIFFDSAMTALALSPQDVGVVSAYGASLEIACYPCTPKAP